jgi:hypothetical protein
VSPAAMSRGDEREVSPRTVVYRGRDVLEVYRRWIGE